MVRITHVLLIVIVLYILYIEYRWIDLLRMWHIMQISRVGIEREIATGKL